MQEEEWMSLTPTLRQGSLLVIKRTVAQWNSKYEQAQMPQNLEELDSLVQDLRDNLPTPITTLTHPADQIAKEQEPAPQDTNQELSTPTNPTPAVFMEIIAETPRQPLLLTQRATAVPSTPTPAAKCLRPEFRRRPRKGQPVKRSTTDKGGPHYSTPLLLKACSRYCMGVGTFQASKRNCSGLEGSSRRLL